MELHMGCPVEEPSPYLGTLPRALLGLVGPVLLKNLDSNGLSECGRQNNGPPKMS